MLADPGVSVFSQPEKPQLEDELLYMKGADAEATGYEVADGFVVLKGSYARTTETPSIHPYLVEIRQSLVSRKIFGLDGSQYVLEQDYTFNSPSQAAAVMMGRTANGRIEWKNENGTTLKELQQNGNETG